MFYYGFLSLNSIVVLEKDEAYFNFIKYINSEATRKNYRKDSKHRRSKFLNYCNLHLDSLLIIIPKNYLTLSNVSSYQSKGSSKSLLIPDAPEDSTTSKELVAEAEGYP